MAKITLNDLTTNYGSQTLHNTNNGEIESHLNSKILYRDNPSGEPNRMENELDMNSNRILNLPDAITSQEPATYSQLVNQGSFTIASGDARYFDTVTQAAADTTLVAGDVIILKDRLSSLWDVVLTNTVVPNTYNIIISTAVPTVSFVLRTSDVIKVGAVGAIGDGSTDDTAALLAAFALLPVGLANNDTTKVVSFESEKTYMFTPPAFGIDLNSVYGFRIEGNFSEIKVPDAVPTVGNGVIMWMEDCVDGLIENLVFNGNLQNRTGNEAQGAHNIKLRNQNKRLKFKNCKFKNATTDGFYMDATTNLVYSEDIELIDCEASGCFRGNITIIDSERFKMRGGSTYGAVGANPQHGIDFEDNGIYGNKNWIVEDIDIYNNAGEGAQISGSLGVFNGVLRNIRLWNNGSGDNSFSPGADFGSDLRIGLFNGLIVEDVYVKGNTNDVSRASIDFTSAASTNLVLRNITMNDINLTGTGTKYAVYLHSSILGPVDISNITIDGTNSIGLSNDVDDATIHGLTIRNSTAGQPISGNGKRALITDTKLVNNAEPVIYSGDNPVFDGFYSVDCAHATLNLWVNAAGATVRNALAEHTVSKNVGQRGFVFTGIPREVSNVRAFSPATDYDGTNVVDFLGGVDSTTALANINPGHWTEERVSLDVGDASKVLSRGADEQVIVYNTALTSARTITLPTTNVRNGDKFRVIRTAVSTGSSLTVATVAPANITLTAGDYTVVQYNGTSWVSVEKGTI